MKTNKPTSGVKPLIIGLAAITALSACDNTNRHNEIPLSEVPENIIKMVQNALPGISLNEAEQETENGQLIYELEGKMPDGKEYEVEITESGTFIKIELED